MTGWLAHGVTVAPAVPLEVASVHPLMAVLVGLVLAGLVAAVLWLSLWIAGAVD